MNSDIARQATETGGCDDAMSKTFASVRLLSLSMSLLCYYSPLTRQAVI